MHAILGAAMIEFSKYKLKRFYLMVLHVLSRGHAKRAVLGVQNAHKQCFFITRFSGNNHCFVLLLARIVRFLKLTTSPETLREHF